MQGGDLAVVAGISTFRNVDVNAVIDVSGNITGDATLARVTGEDINLTGKTVLHDKMNHQEIRH